MCRAHLDRVFPAMYKHVVSFQTTRNSELSSEIVTSYFLYSSLLSFPPYPTVADCLKILNVTLLESLVHFGVDGAYSISLAREYGIPFESLFVSLSQICLYVNTAISGGSTAALYCFFLLGHFVFSLVKSGRSSQITVLY